MNREYDYTCPQCKRQLMNDDVMQEEVHVHYRSSDGHVDPSDYGIQYWCVECAERKAVRTHKENGDTYYEYFQREKTDTEKALAILCDKMHEEYADKVKGLLGLAGEENIKTSIRFGSELIECAEAKMLLDWANDWVASYLFPDDFNEKKELSPYEKKIEQSVFFLLEKEKPLAYMLDKSMNTERFNEEARFADIAISSMEEENDAE